MVPALGVQCSHQGGGVKNYSENVSDFLKAVGPWLDVDAGVRTTTIDKPPLSLGESLGVP